MNLLQIRQKARRKLDETTEKFWKDSELNDYINQGQRYYWKWLIRAQHKDTFASSISSIVAGTSSYALPSDYISMRKVEYVDSDLYSPLTYYDRLDTPSAAQNGTEGSMTYSFQGSNLILTPAPMVSVTDGLKMSYIKMCAELSSDTSTPELSLDNHDLLVIYCVIQAKEKEEAIAGGGGVDLAPFIRTKNELEELFKETIQPQTLQQQFVTPLIF